jgi:hypothetical protein
MKNLIITLLIILGFALQANSQTLIATCNTEFATMNHNQRKIVRDYDHHIYVFYQDYINGSWGIYQVIYDSLTSSWSQPDYLVPGNNPAAAIGFTDSIFLTYRSNDESGKIMLMKKAPDGDWLPPVQISMADSLDNLLPVAEVDMEEKVLVSWIERGNPDDKVMFYKNGTVNEIYVSDSISDLSLSTSLQWNIDNAFFVALEESGERVKFFKFYDINEMEIYLDTLGTKPCQSIGAYSPGNWESLFPRLMYIDDEKNLSLSSVDSWGSYYYIYGPYVLVDGLVFDVAIDDELDPIGFGFLYSDNNGFYNAFASHSEVPEATIIDWLPTYCYNFSIAYKHFSPTIVDFIWMQNSGQDYGIYYKRSNKIPYDPGLNIKVNKDSGNELWFSSNPFKDKIALKLYTNEATRPTVKICDLRGSVIKSITEITHQGDCFSFEWDGENESGSEVNSATYILNITIGKHVLNNLIVKE